MNDKDASKIESALETYNIEYWSEGYFAIDSEGYIQVQGLRENPVFTGSLSKLYDCLLQAGLRPPILIRFTDILQDRVKRLQQAFSTAMAGLNYAQERDTQASFTVVYPIKVNQQKKVVESILSTSTISTTSAVTQVPQRYVGLEVGSKAELLAALSVAHKQLNLLICNGYKDIQYLELALYGMQLGLPVYIVIEKISEFDKIVKICQHLDLKPRLGVRVRLHNTGQGNWQNTGGPKGKFGLSAPQLLILLERLKQHDWLDCLQLLHVHMGSQLSNIQDLKNCVSEAVRYYVELAKTFGIVCQYFDLGGGLAIDYEGTGSTNTCSMNYSMEEYALTVCKIIQTACQLANIACPDLVTESGRALTAHHAVLLTNIVDCEQAGFDVRLYDQEILSSTVQELRQLFEVCQQSLSQRKAVETYHQLCFLFDNIQIDFQKGVLDLKDKALSESLFYQACQALWRSLEHCHRAHRVILDDLNDRLSYKLFVNLSVFKSLPDVWGIDQVFPIMPIRGLVGKPCYERVKLHDLTCDSDGMIELYVDNLSLESTMPFPRQELKTGSIVGFFLIGAYQEILGDLHNLFGSTDSVDVSLQGKDNFVLSNLNKGDSTQKVLAEVNFQGDNLITALEQKIMRSPLENSEKFTILKAFRKALDDYTYLIPESF